MKWASGEKGTHISCDKHLPELNKIVFSNLVEYKIYSATHWRLLTIFFKVKMIV